MEKLIKLKTNAERSPVPGLLGNSSEHTTLQGERLSVPSPQAIGCALCWAATQSQMTIFYKAFDHANSTLYSVFSTDLLTN
jgi:hypothetical protein